MSFDVVIPTLGKSPCLDDLIDWLLRENPCKIFIVGNVNKTYKNVTFVKSDKGYSRSVNKGVALCKSKYVLIVNDDIRPSKGSIESLVKIIEGDDYVFSVTPKIKTIKNNQEINESLIGLKIKNGRPWPTYGIKPPEYPNGAIFLVRKNYWKKLEGYFEGYHPAYWEDADLGFRAVNEGFVLKYTDSLEVEHLRGKTTGNFSPDYLKGIFLRGQRVFTSRHYRKLNLNITWWIFEFLSQIKDFLTFRWKKLLFRWGFHEDSI